MKSKSNITKNKLNLELKIKLLDYLKQEDAINDNIYNYIQNKLLIKLEKL